MITALPNMPNPTAVQSVVVGHEIPFSPLTSAGIAWDVHAWPAFWVVRTASTPAAKQSAGLGHETEFRLPMPAGGICGAHDKPPVVVPMIVEPAPGLSLLPTAMQSTEFEQETPVRSTAFGGGFWRDQDEPLFDVLMTYGVASRLVPTAMHVVSRGHAIEFS
jgi:hypothetical protein